MEIILIVVIFFFIVCVYAYRQIKMISNRLEFISRQRNELQKELLNLSKQLFDLSEQHRDMLNFVESLEANRPIKPNNFDSLKEAFKGPTRVNINERNRAL